MAFLQNLQIPSSVSLYLLLLIFFTNTHQHISFSSAKPFSLVITTDHSTTANADDIHDLLPQYGLPKGLLPQAANSYSLSSDGSFSVQLTHPCYVQFTDQLVYYDKNIKGKLTYGSVSGVSGIQAKKLFLWVTVTGMNVDTDSGMIEFHVGALSQKLPAKEFDTIPDCKNKACQMSRPQSI